MTQSGSPHHPEDVPNSVDALSSLESKTEESKADLSHNRASSLPVHHPPNPLCGLIQPHGVVILAQGDALRIVRVSQNLESLLHWSPESALGRSLRDILGDRAFDYLLSVKPDIDQVFQATNPQYLPLTLASGQPLEGWLHWANEHWVLELEAAPQSSPIERSVAHRIQHFRSKVAQLQQATTVQTLLQDAAIATQQLTHFDRVLIHRFEPDGSGTVVAEVTATKAFPGDGNPSDEAALPEPLPKLLPKPLPEPAYLGLRFPATDIPVVSRQHYARGTLRYVPDLEAPQVGFVPAFDTAAAELLRHTIVRAVDDCCVAYHRNMGVRAFLVIPLLQQGKLWGLMVAHHRAPVTLPVAVRLDCAWLGQILAAELAQKESQQMLVQRERLKGFQSEFLAAIAQSDDFVNDLVHPALRLLGLVNAQGAAVFFEDQITCVGEAPPEDDLTLLYSWAVDQVEDSIFFSDNLPQHYPPAAVNKDVASGMIFLLVSAVRRYAIAWFRPEVLHTIHWAGNPADSYQSGEDGSLQLCPRASFASWQETVRLTSLPWQPWEIESALDLRNAIVGVLLRKADEMARLNYELERSNQELAAFAYAASHDLKEPLRGISNYSRLLLNANQAQLDDKSVARLETLITLSRRMANLIDALLRFSRIGQAELNLQSVDLNRLLERVVETRELSGTHVSMELRIPRPLPHVFADPVLLSEVYNNLLSNAWKYNQSNAPWVEVGYYDANELRGLLASATEPPAAEPLVPEPLASKPPLALRSLPAPLLQALILQAPIFYVRDNGIGILPQHWDKVFELFKRLHSQKKYGGGTGAGLTISKKIIERHDGKINVCSDDSGTTFYWTLG